MGDKLPHNAVRKYNAAVRRLYSLAIENGYLSINVEAKKTIEAILVSLTELKELGDAHDKTNQAPRYSAPVCCSLTSKARRSFFSTGNYGGMH